MELINKNEVSLGCEPFDVLGFKDQEALNNEILKLMRVRPEFESKNKISSN